MAEETLKVRIDKWLWAARLFKTRALAAHAVEGGKVQLNGDRVKPAKQVKPGDALVVRNGAFTWEVEVLALGERRGPAAEAAKLYRESEASRKTREDTAALLRAERQSSPVQVKGRPTKKQRRQIIRFIHGDD